jgi:F-type H+-transporting ATPase subunit epsilon
MGPTTNLEIYTPDRLVLQKPVEYVLLPALEGEMGVLPGHMRLVTVLKAGPVNLVCGAEKSTVTIAEGIGMIEPNKVKVFTTSAIGG